MLSARVEAAGFTADDVWRWRGAKAGRVPLSAKDPSFSDYEVFARDNSLITESEYSRYEDVRRVGNASSHAGRRGFSEGPSEEDLRAACRSAEELLAGMAQGGPGAAAGDARKAVYLDILGSAPGAARGRRKGDGPIREAFRNIWDEMSVGERNTLLILLGLAALVTVCSIFPGLAIGIGVFVLLFKLFGWRVR